MGLRKRTDPGEELPRIVARSSGDWRATEALQGRQLSHLARWSGWFVGTRSSTVCSVTSHPARLQDAIRCPAAGMRRQNAQSWRISHIGSVMADLSSSQHRGWLRCIAMCTCGRLEHSQPLDMKACLLSLQDFSKCNNTYALTSVPFRSCLFDTREHFPNLRRSSAPSRLHRIHHEDRSDCGVQSNKL